MDDRDRKTPPGRPSSMRIAMWNLVETWMTEDPEMREVKLHVVTGRGFCAYVRKGMMSEEAVIKPHEEPCNVVLRLISILS